MTVFSSQSRTRGTIFELNLTDGSNDWGEAGEDNYVLKRTDLSHLSRVSSAISPQTSSDCMQLPQQPCV